MSKKQGPKHCLICECMIEHNEPIVHETCHDERLKDQATACVECEREFGEVDVDQLVAELRAMCLPHCRPVAV